MASIKQIKAAHAAIFFKSTSKGLHRDLYYKSLYGLSIFQIWVLTAHLATVLHPPDYSSFSTKHVLWTLYYLKNYPLRVTAARVLKTSEWSFDKYVWYCIKLISDINNVSLVCFIVNIFSQFNFIKISFNDRFKGRVIGKSNYVTLDGTDFSIYDPKPFHKKWFSFKLNRAGIRYEVGLCLAKGHIVWYNDGFAAGYCNDLKLSRLEFTSNLLYGERAIADKGYSDEKYFLTPNCLFYNRKLLKNIMARHENVNQRIKSFQVMRQMFRHGWEKHILCFTSVIKLVQIKLQNGEPLPQLSIV